MRLSKLKDLRRNSGLSQEELAEVSGVSRATICDLENLRRSCWPKTASKIADALDVYVADLRLPQGYSENGSADYHRARMRVLEERNAELVNVLKSFMDSIDNLDAYAMRNAALEATILLSHIPQREKS